MHLHQPLHQRQADAEPALRPLERAIDLREHVEDALELVGRDAAPGVLDRHHDVAVPHRSAVTEIVPPGRRVLAAVVEQVAEHLRQAHRIGVQSTIGSARQRHLQLVAGRVGERTRRFDRLLDHRRELDAALAQLEPIVGDAVQIEQVVDQPHQLSQLPLHGVARASQRTSASPSARFRTSSMLRQRRERIAQLVRERRQELVLAAVGFGQVRRQLAQIVFQPLALGDVLADRREAPIGLPVRRRSASTPCTPSSAPRRS